MVDNYAIVFKLMNAVRVKSDSGAEEIEDLVNACIVDLHIAGVYVKDPMEPLCYQAIKLYVKSHYGYDENTDKFKLSYSALKDSMALCGDYAKREES